MSAKRLSWHYIICQLSVDVPTAGINYEFGQDTMVSAFCVSSQTCIRVVLTCSGIIVQDAQTLHEAAKMGDIEATRRLLNEVSKSLVVLQTPHLVLKVSLQIRLSVCMLTSHMQLPERTLPYRDDMQHYDKVWGQVMASASSHQPCLKLKFLAGNSLIRLLTTCKRNNFMPPYGLTFAAKCT